MRYETGANTYAEKQKMGGKPRVPVMISNAKQTQLEAEKWTDKVFTGDPDRNNATLTFGARDREMKKNDKLKGRVTSLDPTVGDRIFRTTYKENAKNILRPAGTLYGKIDLIRINDIRRTLRIRYAARNDL